MLYNFAVMTKDVNLYKIFWKVLECVVGTLIWRNRAFSLEKGFSFMILKLYEEFFTIV